MIKNMFTLCLTSLIFVFFCHNASGENHRGGQGSGGFSGTIKLGAIQVISKNQLNADDDNKRIDNLDEPSKEVNEIFPLPLFDLNYAFQNGTSLYLGIPFEDGLRPTFGVTQRLPGGSIGLFFHYSILEEVWEDPYLTGVDRNDTDRTGLGGSIQYKIHNFEIGYEYSIVDVDKDLIGERFEELKRDGAVHKPSFGYKIKLGQGNMLVPKFSYTFADMDGDSNTYNGYKGELSFMKMSESYMLMLSVNGGLKDYDKDRPIFNETREDKHYGAMGMLTWLKPFGYKRFSLSLGGGYAKTDSEIDFFDSDSYFGLTTIGYHFGSGGR
ncbi:DUF2860 family protein [Desulfococcaceae bacterium HSG7]|nr:DUF2860 family protein [Desulfococcaceae bacterium HSG7]